jgi:hypothetical protein
MLNLEKCKKILQKDGQKYTDEEVKQIRDLLYKIGQLDYQIFKSSKLSNNGKCNSLHKSIN